VQIKSTKKYSMVCRIRKEGTYDYEKRKPTKIVWRCFKSMSPYAHPEGDSVNATPYSSLKKTEGG
jgi:hypothetical protein